MSIATAYARAIAALAATDRATRKSLRRATSRMCAEMLRGRVVRLTTPLLYEERHMPDGEDVIAYGYVYPQDMDVDSFADLTDGEIREWFEDHIAYRPCYDYDCSGARTTHSLSWHVNPCGLISYVHRWGLDI